MSPIRGHLLPVTPLRNPYYTIIFALWIAVCSIAQWSVLLFGSWQAVAKLTEYYCAEEHWYAMGKKTIAGQNEKANYTTETNTCGVLRCMVYGKFALSVFGWRLKISRLRISLGLWGGVGTLIWRWRTDTCRKLKQTGRFRFVPFLVDPKAGSMTRESLPSISMQRRKT